jgi:hypothetical protein
MTTPKQKPGKAKLDPHHRKPVHVCALSAEALKTIEDTAYAVGLKTGKEIERELAEKEIKSARAESRSQVLAECSSIVERHHHVWANKAYNAWVFKGIPNTLERECGDIKTEISKLSEGETECL